MDDVLCGDVIKHHRSATDETVVPSSEVPPPWFADAASSEAKAVDRVDDQPVGFSAFFGSSELSSSDGNGFFGEPIPPVEPAWHDDPAVRALAPSPEPEPASSPVVSDASTVDPQRDDPGPRTFVFVNGVATVVPYTRAEALARGYAVVEYEDEATNDTDASGPDSAIPAVHAPTDESPVALPPTETVEPLSSVPVGGTDPVDVDGALTRANDIAPAVRSEDWPAAGLPAPVEPVTWSPSAVESLPPWLTPAGSAPTTAPERPEPERPEPEQLEPEQLQTEQLETEQLETEQLEVVDSPDASVLDESDLHESDLHQPDLHQPDLPESVLDDPVVEHPVFAEPAIAEQLVQVAVSGNAPTLSASAPEASDPESILAWLRGLAPDEAPIAEAPIAEAPIVEAPAFATPQPEPTVTPTPVPEASTLPEASTVPDASTLVVETPAVSTGLPGGSVTESFPLQPQGFQPLPTPFNPTQSAAPTPITGTVETRPTTVRPSDPDSDLRFATGPWVGSRAKVDAEAPAIIEARGLGRAYRKGSREIVVLRDIDLTIREGEFVAITGPSGSGKTTLLHCLAGLDDLSAGTVVVDGFELHNLTDGERSRHRSAAMGFAFQSYNLVPSLTALENVELPLMLNNWPQDASAEEARAALDLVGLRDRADFLPDELSGGEQQRIAIARAVVGEPKVLWADEPTGNLDDATADQVLQVFRELNHSGLTIVMVTHDAAVARLAHRVIELTAGEIRRVTEQVAS